MAIKTAHPSTLPCRMTRAEYRHWRQMIRSNGRAYSMRHAPAHVRNAFTRLRALEEAFDAIADRVLMRRLFREAGQSFTVRHTIPHHLLQRAALKISHR